MNFEDVKYNWLKISELVSAKAAEYGRQSDDVKIISVSKTHPFSVVRWGMEAGIRVFGENYVQELVEKQEEALHSDIYPEWHFIGHLQTNKVKYIVPFVSMIHSVDSLHLAEEISKHANKCGRTVDILLQVNSSGELSKSGCEPGEVFTLFEQVLQIPNVSVKGLMTIGSFSYDEDVYRAEFRLMKGLLNELNQHFPKANLKELSMGMSGDFEAAIEEGSTMVRIGTAIFGERDYR